MVTVAEKTTIPTAGAQDPRVPHKETPSPPVTYLGPETMAQNVRDSTGVFVVVAIGGLSTDFLQQGK